MGLSIPKTTLLPNHLFLVAIVILIILLCDLHSLAEHLAKPDQSLELQMGNYFFRQFVEILTQSHLGRMPRLCSPFTTSILRYGNQKAFKWRLAMHALVLPFAMAALILAPRERSGLYSHIPHSSLDSRSFVCTRPNSSWFLLKQLNPEEFNLWCQVAVESPVSWNTFLLSSSNRKLLMGSFTWSCIPQSSCPAALGQPITSWALPWMICPYTEC